MGMNAASPAIALADHNTPLVRNAWYVAARSSELGQTLLARTLLDTRIVLYRKRDGALIAMHDRCPHRSFPLSKGRLEEDRIVCGYHGLVYDSFGKCVHIPSSPDARNNMRVKTYPLVERGPLVWIWPGDPALSDEAQIPKLEWLADPAWASVTGDFHMKSNYVAMHENLLDQTHFTFLHAGSVGTPEWAAAPLDVSQEGDVVTLRRELKESEPPGIYATPMKIEGKRVDRVSEASFIGPAGHVAFAKITDPETRSQYRVNITHLFTPETQNTLHYWWFNSRDFALGDEAASKFFFEASSQAYNEDVEALEWISDIQLTEKPYREFSIRSDRPGLLMRQAISRMALKEA